MKRRSAEEAGMGCCHRSFIIHGSRGENHRRDQGKPARVSVNAKRIRRVLIFL